LPKIFNINLNSNKFNILIEITQSEERFQKTKIKFAPKITSMWVNSPFLSISRCDMHSGVNDTAVTCTAVALTPLWHAQRCQWHRCDVHSRDIDNIRYQFLKLKKFWPNIVSGRSRSRGGHNTAAWITAECWGNILCWAQ
jgi:hypothetical protein